MEKSLIRMPVGTTTGYHLPFFQGTTYFFAGYNVLFCGVLPTFCGVLPTYLRGTTYFFMGYYLLVCRGLPTFLLLYNFGPTAIEKKDKIAINGDRKRSSVKSGKN